MKKFLIVMLMFVFIGLWVPSASAQTSHRRHRHSRTFWQKHRDKLTVAGTTAAGVGIGSVIGGKKGALIGAGAGAGSGALYTYKLRKRHRRPH